MENTTSKVTGKCTNSKQHFVHSKGATARLQKIDVRRVQNVHLIWLDQNIDENNADCRNTINKLRQVVNDITIFTDTEQCVQFIENTTDTKACIILSGSLGQYIVPRIHNMPQVDSIYILYNNEKYHKQWIKHWTKIIDVYTEISSVCEALNRAAELCEQNAISISFVAPGCSNNVSKHNLDQLDPMFMCSQIVKEISLTIQFDHSHMQQFLDHCRDIFVDNDKELQNINKFEKNYHKETPIWWYTCESFLYPMLNRAIRVMDVDIIIEMGFFINDLHRHIERLHTKQFSGGDTREIFTVYRGQGLSKTDFDKMTETEGGLITFNNFLSTSKNYRIPLRFARRALLNVDIIGVLFVITIDPAQSRTPFASTADIEYYGDKKSEVLFSMHTVFRIGKITPTDENPRLVRVNLTLTNGNDKDLRVLTDCIREKSSSEEEEGWYRLGLLLLKVGESVKAQQVYEILLKQTTDMVKKARIFHQLGLTKSDQGEYQEAVIFYEKALEIYKETLSPTDLSLANCYNNIGLVYCNMDDYSKALSFHERALEIRKQLLPSNHHDLASSYYNMGLVYCNMNDYPKALSSHRKALEIREKSLPSNHPDIASSYFNIGSIYSQMGDYSKALASHEKALKIQQQSFPLNHPDIASSYFNIGLMYSQMGDYPEALSFHEKALEIREQSLPSNHPDLVMSFHIISLVHHYMGDYPKALSYCEKALEIKKQSLPPNHSRLAMFYKNIGLLYEKMNDYSNALSHYEKTLEIQQQSLSLKHPELGGLYNSIGWLLCKMGNYVQALPYAEQAIEIQELSLPPNHPDLGASYDTIGLIYCKLGNYPNALRFCEKAIRILEQVLPKNHPSFCILYTNIGEVYENMGDYSKAHSFYERVVSICKGCLPVNGPYFEDYKTNLERVKNKL